MMWVVLPKAGSPKCLGGSKQSDEKSGKDGYTVKKLIALMLVVVFLSVSVVGCGGDTKPSTPAKGGTGTPPAGAPDKK